MNRATSQEAQRELNALLGNASAAKIADGRAACATGDAAKWQRMLKESGFQSPSPGAWCVTVLTRVGRDGGLGYVRDPRATGPTPSIAFDGGFVGGYLKHEAVATGTPSMDALLPVADRCLEQREANLKLCSAVGYVLGSRAAQGELVASR